MNQEKFNTKVRELFAKHKELVSTKNTISEGGNGIYNRYNNPAITRNHTPVFWRYDLDYNTNPNLLTRLGINTTFNAGAIKLNGKYLMAVRTEGFDVKSFFSIAESDNGIDGWRFWDRPIVMPSNETPETNVYDLRLTQHEDGWIYGLFCAERKDLSKPHDSSAALASCGIARTKDLITWERLPDLQSNASQQRNCVLHSEFVNGKYMVYTRPQSGFIDTGENSGIHVGFSDSMSPAILGEETIMDPRKYHTYKEVKNGQGPAPKKKKKGWLHLAHGVRYTAAGLRYVLYCFMTDINEPWKVIKRPAGHFIEPLGDERVGDVSNVVFSNGWIVDGDKVFIYYASSDTRMHVATTTLEKLMDYVMNTPDDPGRTELCAAQRDEMILKNLDILKKDFSDIDY